MATKRSEGGASRTAGVGKSGRDPRGGLNAEGRAQYARSEGARLRPGVTKPDKDMTPEDMKRKGSFLRRHFANPRGPMMDDQGRPTRLALSAQAWGERPPKDEDGARKLADKGSRYLEKYHRAKDKEKAQAADEPRSRPSASRERRG